MTMRDGEEIKKGILKILTIIFVFLIINILSGNLSINNTIIDRTIAIYLLIALLIFNINIKLFFLKIKEHTKDFFPYATIGAIVIIGSFILLFISSARELWLLQLPIFLTGLDLIIQANGEKKPELFIFSIASLVYLLFSLVIQNFSPLFIVIQNISIGFSQAIGGMFTIPYLLSSTTSGFWIFITGVFFIAVMFLFSEGKKQKKNIYLIITCLGGLLISWIGYIIVQNIVTFKSELDRIDSLYIMFIFSVVPIVVFSLFIKQKTIQWYAPRLTTRRVQKPFFTAATILICILLFLSGFLLLFLPPSSTSKKTITVGIYQSGIIVGALDAPQYGNYGRYASGFFGLLPEYLETYHYSVNIINESLTKDILDRNDVLVIINLGTSFDTQTLTLIWGFVERGGSLLVMTDHTDLGGIMTPFNTLLEPVGIHVRFDSGIPIKDHWLSCYYLFHHQITEELNPDYNFDISVGATLSLDITKSSFPLIIGKGGFSDHGNYLNNSNLGDYTINRGEQFGDVILAAGAYYGKGRVIAFGDTSSFQNLALSSNHQFISNIVTWLTTGDTGISQDLISYIALTLLGGAAVLFIFFHRKPSILFPLIFAFALISATSLNSLLLRDQTMEGPMVFIDVSHNEQINRDFDKDNSITGLMINLIRNEYKTGKRYLPIIIDSFSEEKLFQSKILVLVAPMKPFTAQEVDKIEQFMISGGLVILSSGYTDKDSPSLLLKRLHLDILPIPLGPVPYGEENESAFITQPRFVDSWPIFIQGNVDATHVFYNVSFGPDIYNLVVFTKVGEGGLLLIGDSKYFLDKNLEGFNNFWLGNIAFFKSMIEEMKKEGVPK